MSATSLSAGSEENLRRARVKAKWSMRHYRREYGSYTKNDLIHSVRMAGWLFERIRVEGPALSLQHLECMQDHLLLKLAVVELALTEIVSCPAPTDRCST